MRQSPASERPQFASAACFAGMAASNNDARSVGGLPPAAPAASTPIAELAEAALQTIGLDLSGGVGGSAGSLPHPNVVINYIYDNYHLKKPQVVINYIYDNYLNLITHMHTEVENFVVAADSWFVVAGSNRLFRSGLSDFLAKATRECDDLDNMIKNHTPIRDPVDRVRMYESAMEGLTDLRWTFLQLQPIAERLQETISVSDDDDEIPATTQDSMGDGGLPP